MEDISINEFKPNYENKGCPEPQYCCNEKKCVLRPNRTMMKCSSTGSITIPINTAGGTSYNLTNMNLDTRRFNNPCIKFDFVCNISAAAATVALNFQVQKICKNQLTPIPIGAVWTFSRQITAFDELDSFSFSFFVCDCDACDDECCNYSVSVTAAGLSTGGVTSINNAVLNAIVVDNPDCL